jgi:hypothetical protein
MRWKLPVLFSYRYKMNIKWPELTFPPINLWSYPRMKKDFIRIHNIIFNVKDISALVLEGEAIKVILTSGNDSNFTFHSELAATEYFDSLEAKLLSEFNIE